jgi:hypothetical protein
MIDKPNKEYRFFWWHVIKNMNPPLRGQKKMFQFTPDAELSIPDFC